METLKQRRKRHTEKKDNNVFLTRGKEDEYR